MKNFKGIVYAALSSSTFGLAPLFSMDEYVEVTPHAMRLRKILLNETDRKRASK